MNIGVVQYADPCSCRESEPHKCSTKARVSFIAVRNDIYFVISPYCLLQFPICALYTLTSTVLHTLEVRDNIFCCLTFMLYSKSGA